MKIGAKNIKTAAAVMAMSAAVLLSGCAGKETQSMADYIGIDAAQEAALAEAGISASDADFSVSGLDSRDGTFFYEVRFSSGDKEYEYAVDALTGVVIEEVIKPLDGEGNSEASKEVSEEAANETVSRAEVAEGQEGSPASGKADAEGRTSAAAQDQSESVPAITRDPSSSKRGYIGLSGSNLPSWEGSLNEEEAKQIALSDAKVSDDDIAFILVEKDWDDGIATYDVEFVTNDLSEYDYEIDAVSGEIIAMDQDMEHHYEHYRGGNNQSGGQNSGAGSAAGSGNGAANGQGAGSGSGQGGNGYGGELISEEDAKAKVLERVPGAAASDIRMKLERDDGRLEYEGELYHDGMEYEFKIDAYSGSVTEWESERM